MLPNSREITAIEAMRSGEQKRAWGENLGRGEQAPAAVGAGLPDHSPRPLGSPGSPCRTDHMQTLGDKIRSVQEKL